jgi:hypothetical protein
VPSCTSNKAKRGRRRSCYLVRRLISELAESKTFVMLSLSKHLYRTIG